MSKLIYGDMPHPDIATSLNNLGSAYKDLGDITKAITYYEESYAMFHMIYGAEHPSTQTVKNNLERAKNQTTPSTSGEQS